MKLGCGREAIGEAARLLREAGEEFIEMAAKASKKVASNVVLPVSDFLFGEPDEHDKNIRDYKLRK